MSKEQTLKILKGLIGKRAFIKCKSYDNYYYNDSDKVEIFTVDDYEFYEENILADEIKLSDVILLNDIISNYNLIIFEDLVYRC